MKSRTGFMFLLIVLAMLAPPALAQEFRATVTGRVVDADGLGMPGVTVSVTNTATNDVVTA